MPQATDVVIDGAGYMVVPGSYERGSAGEPETRPGRWTQRDFVGGQRRAIQMERDRGWDSEGVGPALGGQGVEPWPRVEAYADTGIAGKGVSKTPRSPHTHAHNRLYVGAGRYLLKGTAYTAAWGGFTAIDTGAAYTISALAHYRGDVAIAYDTGKDLEICDNAGTRSVWKAGEEAAQLIGYKGQLIYNNANVSHELRLSTNGAAGTIDTRLLDSRAVRLALHNGAVAIATKTSIYLLAGEPDATAGEWLGDPEPLMTHGMWTQDQDFQFLVSFQGKLYAWLAGQVQEYNPNAGASRQGWRPTGLEGKSCFGATVAAGWLWVATQSRRDLGELWGWDGVGWWLVDQGADPFWPVWPADLSGSGDNDLISFRAASAVVTYELIRSSYRGITYPNLGSSGSYKTSLIDCGEPGSMKAWLRAGVAFAAPEVRHNDGSTDPVNLALAYSIDGGETFTDLITAAPDDPTDRDLVLTADWPINTESHYLALRVSWSSVTDWAPTLTAVWCDYEVLSSPVRRRRWRMKVHARDQTIERSGAKHARTGRQLSADLWSAWALQTTLTLRDIDYDADPVQRAVRILSIKERAAKPADAARWGESEIELVIGELG